MRARYLLCTSGTSMKRSPRFFANILAGSLLYLVTQGPFAHPCGDVDRSLTESEKVSLAPALESHMKTQFDPSLFTLIMVQRNDVLGMFRAGGWYIVHVNNHATDDPYLFYSTDPTRASHYVGAWGGAAAADEGPKIQAWVTKEMSGIPKALAKCFTWYVTKGNS
jgi:hypothetical protein